MQMAYFSAQDDAAAAEAEARAGGPLGWPVITAYRRVGLLRREPVLEALGPAYDGFETRGYDPMVTMGILESLLSGIRYEELEGDAQWGGSPTESETLDGVGVMTLTDSLRDALAAATDADLNRVAEPWSRTEELSGIGWDGATVADHLHFLEQLRDLARAASPRGHHLYCYFEG